MSYVAETTTPHGTPLRSPMLDDFGMVPLCSAAASSPVTPTSLNSQARALAELSEQRRRLDDLAISLQRLRHTHTASNLAPIATVKANALPPYQSPLPPGLSGPLSRTELSQILMGVTSRLDALSLRLESLDVNASKGGASACPVSPRQQFSNELPSLSAMSPFRPISPPQRPNTGGMWTSGRTAIAGAMDALMAGAIPQLDGPLEMGVDSPRLADSFAGTEEQISRSLARQGVAAASAAAAGAAAAAAVNAVVGGPTLCASPRGPLSSPRLQIPLIENRADPFDHHSPLAIAARLASPMFGETNHNPRSAWAPRQPASWQSFTPADAAAETFAAFARREPEPRDVPDNSQPINSAVFGLAGDVAQDPARGTRFGKGTLPVAPASVAPSSLWLR